MISNINSSLVDDKQEITIIDYVKLLNTNIFNIDISFIDDFIEFIDKDDDFIIPHEMLFKYQILSKTSSTNVLTSLNTYDLIDQVHYQLLQQQVDDGRTYKNIFYLTQDAFKFICMKSQKKIHNIIFFLKNVLNIIMTIKN